MSTNVLEIRDSLKDNVKFYRQRTPIIYTYSDSEYLKLTKKGIQKLYVDIGWTTWSTDYVDAATPTISKDLTLVEKEYCLIASEIAFWNQCLSDWNTVVGYTTDALSITHTNKIGETVTETLERLRNDLSELFYKLGSTVNTMTSITSITVTELEVDYQ
jgi:hypothetical protein